MANSKSNKTVLIGTVYVTHGVAAKIPMENVLLALERHLRCDWGDVGDEDWKLNDRALDEGTRLVSIYKQKTGRSFWVITEADRQATTVLMPEEY